jgi:hypothetical protein
MSEESGKTLTFEYKISPNFSTYRITGIYGGLNATGDVVMSFFNERAAIPKTQTYEIKDGKLGESPVSEEKKGVIIRDVMFAVSMSADNAREIAKWLNWKADEFNKLVEAQKEKEGAV